MTCKIPIKGVRASTLPELAHLKVSGSGIFSSIIHQAKREMAVAFRGKAGGEKLMTGFLESKNCQVSTLGKIPEHDLAAPASGRSWSPQEPQESQKDLFKT